MPRMQFTGNPDNWRCDCCDRHISELEPYGKEGDPLAGNFEGELLVRVYRLESPPDKELESLWDKYFGRNDDATEELDYDERFLRNEERFISQFGQQKFDQLYYYKEVSGLSGSYGKVALCRDCVVLDDDEYFEKRNKIWATYRENNLAEYQSE